MVLGAWFYYERGTPVDHFASGFRVYCPVPTAPNKGELCPKELPQYNRSEGPGRARPGLGPSSALLLSSLELSDTKVYEP